MIIGIVVVGFFVTYTIQSQPISYADSIFETCYDNDECTIDKLYEISPNSSTQSILLTLDELVDLYVDAEFYCHPAAHHLGEFLFGYLNRDLKMASDISDYRCHKSAGH